MGLMLKGMIKKGFVFVLVFAAVLNHAAGEKTKISGLHKFKLDNGLELYVAENHNVPLAYIEVAVRAGAVAQKKETAGLFHLYEHMMFKGNALYEDAASLNRALGDLGVTEHNGTTSTDRVNYYFTIPSEKLEEGLAFWNAAIRSPKITEKEFENEKKVVLSEIEGDQSNPSFVLHYFMNLKLFPEKPYRTDPRGTFDIVRNATVAQMREMQKEFYIPCNSAVFVGGDVDPDETYELVKKIFGSWKNNGYGIPEKGTMAKKNPLDKAEFIVMPFDKISPSLAQIQVVMRGPDIDFDYEDVLSLMYFYYQMDKPDSLLKTELASNKEYSIPDPTYVSTLMSPGRQNTLAGFYALVLNPEDDLAGRAEKMMREVVDEIYPKAVSDKKLFAGTELKKYAESNMDYVIRASETAEGLIHLASQSWAAGEMQYFLDEVKLPSIKQKKVQEAVEKYFADENPLVCVLVNPAVYEKTKNEFAEKGYYEVKADEEIWWKKDRFKVDVASFPKESDYVADTEIFVPHSDGKDGNGRKISRNVETHELANGIKVYINHTDSKINAVALGCRGGFAKLTPETSGLETSLFAIMSSSSENYPMEKRNQMEFETGASFGNFSRTSGSVLYMTAQDKYFDRLLSVFTDGFLNPRYAENVLQNLFDSNRQRVQGILNNPTSLLSWTVVQDVYKNHPFEARGNVTPLSVENITVDNMKKLHDEIIKGGDFFIAAAGNINSKKFIKTLNGTIGKLAFTGELKKEPKDIPVVKIEKKDPVVLTHPSCLGTAYVTRVFASPEIFNRDIEPCFIASNIYSDILYNVVREHYGICYTPSSGVTASKAPFGQEYLFKVSDYGNIGKAMKEARGYMEKGVVVEKSNEDGSYEVASIEDRLESYKSKWINYNYAEAATSAGQLQNITMNLLHYNDMNYDLIQLENIGKVTADDVVRVFKKYWVDGNSTWYAVTFPGNEKNLKF